MSPSVAPVTVVDSNGVRLITIDRPAVRNSIDLATALALSEAMIGLDADPQLHVGVLTGAGGSFCAGMDLKAFVRGEYPVLPGRGFGGFTDSPPVKPLLAAVEGFALAGGFELALACDIILASEEASFGIPEVTRGLIAAAGGLVRLPQRIAPNVAMELALTGRMIGAQRGYELGLVNQVTPVGGALDAALTLAAVIAANGPLAVLASKQIVREAGSWPEHEVAARQAEWGTRISASEDAKEGSRAFVEKRPPQWTGR